VFCFGIFLKECFPHKTQVYTSGNPYGIAEDIVFSMPCRSKVRSEDPSCLHYFVCRIRQRTLMIMEFFLQGDGDYELVSDVLMDDFLWERIKKVRDRFQQYAVDYKRRKVFFYFFLH
jgi:hypothetical protein